MRAVSFSHARVASLLNAHFVPVFTSNEDYREGGAAPEEERAQLRRIHREASAAGLSVGTVHAFILRPDGAPIDSLHTAEAAKPEKLVAMLERAVRALGVAPGAPVVTPSPQPIPACEPGGLLLHVTARYLERRDGELSLVRDAGGNWSALPGEDWVLFSREEAARLVPAGELAVGRSWRLDLEASRALLLRFYPPTENTDLATNRIEEMELEARIASRNGPLALAEIEGRLRMKHPFYHREDGRLVQAEIVGYMDIDARARRVRSLRMVTTQAEYREPGGSVLPFGVAARSVPPGASASAK